MKKLPARELSRNQSILRFDVILQSLQHYWPIEQCLRHIRDFFGGKTKSPCFDLFIHWLIKQVTNTYRNHFSRSYESRSNKVDVVVVNHTIFLPPISLVPSHVRIGSMFAPETIFRRSMRLKTLN